MLPLEDRRNNVMNFTPAFIAKAVEACKKKAMFEKNDRRKGKSTIKDQRKGKDDDKDNNK